jgi:hypothetical protein
MILGVFSVVVCGFSELYILCMGGAVGNAQERKVSRSDDLATHNDSCLVDS